MEMKCAVRVLTSNDGKLQAQVSLQGGFCQQLYFIPEDGVSHTIFHQAPWLPNDNLQDQPPLMRQLGGEWVGVPFGHGNDDTLFQKAFPHGLPANHLWYEVAGTENQITMGYDFAESYPIKGLRRTIKLQDMGIAQFSLEIIPRRDCALPVGLHPVFPFKDEAGPLKLIFSDKVNAISYPVFPEPGVSRIKPLQDIQDLAAVLTTDNKRLDLTHLPLAFDTEEIVHLLPPVSRLGLYWPARELQVNFHWDSSLLPSCLLWFSNGGRNYHPWNNRNYCLGVEPINSAWDLGPGALHENPISKRGYSTALKLVENDPVVINYRFECLHVDRSTAV